MSLSFSPAAGKHAIDTCTVIVRFVQPVSNDAFVEVSRQAKEVADKNDLPAMQQVVFPSFLHNVGGGVQPAGVVFQRFAKNGTVETEFKCEPMAITLQVRSYDSWAALSSFLQSTMLQLVPLYVSNLPAIAAVAIQYDDRFVASAGAVVAAGELFRPGTPWVTIYDPVSTQPWHSQFGIFIAETDQRRELINVNVIVNDQVTPVGATQRTVGLTTLVSKSFDVPGQQPLIVEAGAADQVVRDLLEDAHTRSKHILNEVLADTYLDAIGAKAG